MRPRVILVGAAALVGGWACGGASEVATPATQLDETRCLEATRRDAPVVALIKPAIAATDAHYGRPQRYFEVSADRQRVSLIVATGDGAAEQVLFCEDDRFVPPEPLGEAEGATFTAADVDLDDERVLSGIEEELDDPDIVDFAVLGVSGGVIYDATVVSDSGGVLLVLLSATGDVLAVQAQ